MRDVLQLFMGEHGNTTGGVGSGWGGGICSEDISWLELTAALTVHIHTTTSSLMVVS